MPAAFDVPHINVHDIQSGDDVSEVLSHLKGPKNAARCVPWRTKKKRERETWLRALSSASLMCNVGPFHHILCVSVDMKVVSPLRPYYHISPRVILVSSLLLKPCQSAWIKWQPSGNWITGRRERKESPSCDLLAKWTDCALVSCALTRGGACFHGDSPPDTYKKKNNKKKFSQVSDLNSTQLMLSSPVSCHGGTPPLREINLPYSSWTLNSNHGNTGNSTSLQNKWQKQYVRAESLWRARWNC